MGITFQDPLGPYHEKWEGYTPYMGITFQDPLGAYNKKWEGYGRLLLTHFLVVLNAALNPVLYMMRMPGFKEKVVRWGGGVVTRDTPYMGITSRDVTCFNERVVRWGGGVVTRAVALARHVSGVWCTPSVGRSGSNHEVVYEDGGLVDQDQDLRSRIRL